MGGVPGGRRGSGVGEREGRRELRSSPSYQTNGGSFSENCIHIQSEVSDLKTSTTYCIIFQNLARVTLEGPYIVYVTT